VNVRAVVLAAAIGAAASSPAAAQQLAAEALVDRDLTVGAGATISATLGALVARAEDRSIPHRLFAERGVLRRPANITYRLLKYTFFDGPQERLLLVFDHEVFGHGARLRERFDGPIEYRIQPPYPYGGGGGSTSFVLDREPTPYELLAVSAGGMESTGVVAAIVAERAFVDRRMHPRDAIRYLTFELDTLRYIASTDDQGEDPGHDVGDFLETYNDLAAAAGAPALTPRRLRREALVSLANPMAAYAAYGIARYWWNGATDVAVPAISVAGVRYLPLFRYRLTPYGTEWALVNALAGRMRPTEVEVRIGRSPQATPWGIGVRQREAARWRSWTVDGAVDLWQQPPVAESDPQRLAFEPRMGARVSARVNRPVVPVWFSASRATLVVEIGAKSGGYVAGEPLRGGVVARAGIGFPLP
jgi:hypothetical protein